MWVRFLRSIRRNSAGQVGEAQVNVFAFIGRLHRLVAGEIGTDADLHAFEIAVAHGETQWRFDQRACPLARGERESRTGRRMTRRFGAKGPKLCPNKIVLSNLPIIRAKLGEGASQFFQRCEDWMDLAHV